MAIVHIFPTYGYSDQTCCAKELKLNCKTLVRPLIAYGAETWWTLRATDELALRILERRIMRRIYGLYSHKEIGKSSSICIKANVCLSVCSRSTL
jgi:hypothetical protein